MYLRGMRQADIAAQEGVSRDVIKRDVQAIHAEWRAGRVECLNSSKGRELARIDVTSQ
jgi:hypothetical protein